MEMNKKKYFSILEQIKEEHKNAPVTKEHWLIADGNNLVMRNFFALPTMNDNGDNVGAIVGSMKSLGYAIRQVHPTRLLVIFDGKGGSKRRRAIFPDYKEKRQMRVRVNRIYTDLVSVTNEDESLVKQMSRIIQYFECFPLRTMALENIEADDTIAYCSQQLLKDDRITIMSTDKDFLQLVDHRVKVWSPTKKILYGPEKILEQYGISAANFLNYRILDGDKSDNVGGVPGLGLKTILKLFPVLKEETAKTVDEIITFSGYNISNSKIYKKVLDNKPLLNRNHALMQLKEVDIPSLTKLKIIDMIGAPINQLNKVEFMRMLIADKIANSIPNFNVWLSETFGLLDMSARRYNASLAEKKVEKTI